MNKIAGKKELFAIEIEISKREPYLMGKIYIWLANVRIGAPEEENMILPHLNSLRLIANRVENLTNQEFDTLPTEEVFRKVYDGEDFDHRHNFNLGEAFDDFSMIAYKTGQDVVLCAKLIEEPFFEYKGFSNSPIRKAIPFAEFTRVIDQALQVGMRKV